MSGDFFNGWPEDGEPVPMRDLNCGRWPNPDSPRHLPEWSEPLPKLLVPRWVISLGYGALIVTFTLVLAHSCAAV
jgi:hypothetical protein